MNQEIIELLEEIFAIADNDEPDDDPLASFPRIKKLADQALDFLKQQPTAGEWTKLWRERLENAITLYKMGKNPDEWFSSIVTGFQEACDRLDRAEAENIELKAADKTHLSAFNGLQERYLQLESINADLLVACKLLLKTLLDAGYDPEISRVKEIAEAAIAKAKKAGSKKI